MDSTCTLKKLTGLTGVNFLISFLLFIKGVHSRGAMLPKSQVNIELGTILLDLDFTLMDRITALLKPEPLYNISRHSHFPEMYNSLATGKSAV